MDDATVATEGEVEETEVEETEPATDDSEETDTDEVSDDSEEEDEDSEEEEAEDEEPEMLDFDFGGNKLSIPKDSLPEELADKVSEFTKSTWSDYTKKSQEIAETRKSIEAREKAVGKLMGMQGDVLDSYSKGLSLRQEIDRLSQEDMSTLWQSDPDQARRVSDRLSALTAQFNATVNEVSQKEQAVSQAMNEEVSRRMDEGRQFMEKRIKGFSERANDVIDYVTKTYNVPKSDAETWPLNTVTAELAYKAMMFDKLQQKAGKTTKPKPKPAQPVKPIKGKGGKGRVDPEKMSVDEWVKWRERQIKKSAGA